MGKLIVFTGAGISAPSGVPTFRTDNGLWENHRIEDVCTTDALKNNAEVVRNFYNDRRRSLPTVSPNVAHEMVRDLLDKHGGHLITTNVDDLHERAAPSCGVVHVHGELTKLKCSVCGTASDIGYADQTGTETCDVCGGDMRIDVVVFGDAAPMYATMSQILMNMMPEDVFLVIGTTGTVIPVDEYYLTGHNAPFSILCNKDRWVNPDGTFSPGLASNRDLFDKVIFGDVAENIEKIKAIVNEKLK